MRARRRRAEGQRPAALVSARGALRPGLRVPRPAREAARCCRASTSSTTLGPGELLEADDSSLGGGGPPIIPCNWLQHFENVVDSFHVPILHGVFSGNQFVPAMAQMPKVEWSVTERGVRVESWRTLDDGRQLRRVTEAAMPTLRVVPSPRLGSFGPVESIGWVLPIDDTHFRIYVAGRVRAPGDIGRMRSKMNGKFWWELSEEEHRQLPRRLRGAGQPGRDRRALGRAPAHQRPRRRAAAPLPARAAEAGGRGGRPGLRRPRWGRRRDAALRRTAATSSPHEGPARDAADAGVGLHAGHRRARSRARAARVPLRARRTTDLADVDVVLAWQLPPGLASRLPRLRWICSVAAGVEKLLAPGPRRRTSASRASSIASRRPASASSS